MRLAIVRALGAMALGLLAGLAAIPANAMPPAGICRIGQALDAHRNGLALERSANWKGARSQWLELARMGWSPAQSRLARLMAAKKGGGAKPGEAVFWAALAGRAGDGEARALLARQGRAPDQARIAAWRPTPQSCKPSAAPKVRKGKPPAETVKAGGAVFHLTYRMRLGPEVRAGFRRTLSRSLEMAAREPGASGSLLGLIKAFEIAPGDRYARYVGWVPHKKRHFIRLTIGNFSDKSPAHLGRAIWWTLKRRIYDTLPGASLIDPYLRQIGGKKILGSVYPDIRNDRYFKIIEQAFRMVKRLPPKLSRFIKIVDEIHYNPSSRHYVRGGTLDAAAAYYNRILSREGHRLIFFRRNVLYSSPLFFLRSFVHEGTHAMQDQKAWRYNHEIPQMRIRLKNLEAAGKGNTEAARNLRAEEARKFKYVLRWYKGKETPTGLVPDIAFECEATLNEIETVRAAAGSPDAMNDSAYVKLCPEARRRLIRWRDASFAKSRRR
ncbi:MAG: hypothetical protein QGF09_03920 [Rhodospirillales bacterium]|nr:hypothetical protein [Rhodospirillales bacterium]